jgi:hypothetical protein
VAGDNNEGSVNRGGSVKNSRLYGVLIAFVCIAFSVCACAQDTPSVGSGEGKEEKEAQGADITVTTGLGQATENETLVIPAITDQITAPDAQGSSGMTQEESIPLAILEAANNMSVTIPVIQGVNDAASSAGQVSSRMDVPENVPAGDSPVFPVTPQ